MSSSDSYLTPEAARDQIRADLELIDGALGRLQSTSTDLVGNAFRVELAEALETHCRVNRGLSYRVVGEIVDPPDGVEDPNLSAGVRVQHLLWTRLRITPGEIRRRARLAARIRPRRSLTGPPAPPELPELAAAVEDGLVGEDHIRAICQALDVLPAAVSIEDREQAERVLVANAVKYDAPFVVTLGRGIADRLNPDGVFTDADRARRRGLRLSPQGPDGMSRLSGWLDPECRAYLDALTAAMRPGHRVPDGEPGQSDTRTSAQRCHDGLKAGLRAGIASGDLGTHRGLPVTVIATTTLAELNQAAHAVCDPTVPAPPPARTGSGASLPMRDLIRMAGQGSIQYLAVFDDHTSQPLYLGRARRTATADQRIFCYARDRGCTRPGCTEPGDHCEVHHTPDWNHDGQTNADSQHFVCHPDHALVTEGIMTTTVTNTGRLGWSHTDPDSNGPPEVNHAHHPDELLNDDLDS